MESQPPDSIRSSGPCSSQMPGSCRHASPCPLLSLADMAVIQNSPCSTAVVRSKNIYFPHTPRNPTWNCMLFLRSPNMNLWYGLKWILFPRKSEFWGSPWISFSPFLAGLVAFCWWCLAFVTPSSQTLIQWLDWNGKPWIFRQCGHGTCVSLWSTDFHCVCCFINASSVTRLTSFAVLSFIQPSLVQTQSAQVMSEWEQGLLAINTFAQGFAVTYMLRLLHRFKRQGTMVAVRNHVWLMCNDIYPSAFVHFCAMHHSGYQTAYCRTLSLIISHIFSQTHDKW